MAPDCEKFPTPLCKGIAIINFMQRGDLRIKVQSYSGSMGSVCMKIGQAKLEAAAH